MKKIILLMLLAICSLPMMAQNDVYADPEFPAQFNGGQVGLQTWLADNLVYPKEAAAQKIEGRVIVKLTIDRGGNVTSPVILRSADPILDKAAIKLVKKMPKWTPAKKNGKSVESTFVLPISYKL